MSVRANRRQRDFLTLCAYVNAQHGANDKAGVLLESLYEFGEYSVGTMAGRAILRFFKQDWASTLTCLDELDRVDPVERFGRYRLSDRQRLRRYMKARCLYELAESQRARDAVEVYLRHGEETAAHNAS